MPNVNHADYFKKITNIDSTKSQIEAWCKAVHDASLFIEDAHLQRENQANAIASLVQYIGGKDLKKWHMFLLATFKLDHHTEMERMLFEHLIVNKKIKWMQNLDGLDLKAWNQAIKRSNLSKAKQYDAVEDLVDRVSWLPACDRQNFLLAAIELGNDTNLDTFAFECMLTYSKFLSIENGERIFVDRTVEHGQDMSANIIELARGRLYDFTNLFDITAEDSQGRTPLIMAAYAGNLSVVQMLVQDYRVNVNHQDVKGNTAFSIACQMGHYYIVAFLLSKFLKVINCKKPNAEGDLSSADFYSIGKEVELNLANEQQYTPLHFAVYHGHFDVVKRLLADPRINPHAVTADGNTALSIAYQRGHLEIAKILNDTLNMDIHKQGAKEDTPLILACKNGDSKAVKSLVTDYLVDVNALYKGKFSPLHIAVVKGKQDVIDMLLACSRTKLTPIMLEATIRSKNTVLLQRLLSDSRCPFVDAAMLEQYLDKPEFLPILGVFAVAGKLPEELMKNEKLQEALQAQTTNAKPGPSAQPNQTAAARSTAHTQSRRLSL